MVKARARWTLARGGALLLALVPVTIFVLIIANLVWTSRQAWEQVGLFGGTQCPTGFVGFYLCNAFSGTCPPCQYGLIPGIYGTFLATLLALLLALPTATAMAVFASEFSLGGLGRAMEFLLAVFSGIPPVLYALLSTFVVLNFMRPKLSGEGLPADFIARLPGLELNPAYKDLPLSLPSSHSTLLGGIMLALLIIPFMSPLILDAIRNVPASLKEASLGLGANRWYTLWRVTLPGALPGVVAAASLGVLKTVGDLVISAWTMGMVGTRLPSPLWDLTLRTAPLTSQAAGLVGGVATRAGLVGLTGKVVYASGIVLVLFALVILGLAGLAQRYLRRRWAV